MRNKYLKNLNKIEFIVTYACTGRCKHCSEGDHELSGEHIDPFVATDAVRKIAREYDIETVMTFGGEPLLYADSVYSIMSVAKELGIQRRQVITNGYFSRTVEKIRDVAKRLSDCGVNDLLLSVDAFHQETIPLKFVKEFATELKKHGTPVRLSPAWLVSPQNDNPYNQRTREIIESFSNMGIFAGDGNIIFPEGNARKYLSEYFNEKAPQNPYIEDPCNVKCVSFNANGDVLDGNVYRNDIMEIIKNYDPQDGNNC